MSLSNFLKDKKIGFWFSAAIAFLFLLSGILFVSIVPGLVDYTRYAYTSFIPWITAILFIGFVLSIGLGAIKRYEILPYAQGACGLIALLLFVYSSYKYVFELFVGIENMQFYPQIIILAVLFVIILGLSIANIFLKQTKPVEEVGTNE